MCQEKLTEDTLIKTRDGHRSMNTSFNDGWPVLVNLEICCPVCETRNANQCYFMFWSILCSMQTHSELKTKPTYF